MTTTCHVITGLWTGGTERALVELLSHGLAQRFENHVISLSGWGQQAPAVESSGAMLHCLNGRNFCKASVLPALWRQIKAIHPDLIQGWMYHSNLAALDDFSSLEREGLLPERAQGVARFPIDWSGHRLYPGMDRIGSTHNAHNMSMLFGVEEGIIGLVLCLSLLAISIFAVHRAAKLVAIVFLIAENFTHNQFDFTSEIIVLAYCLGAAAMEASRLVARNRRTAKVRTSPT
jgi:hypothetical protein